MTIGPEMAHLGCECPEPGYCYTIEHGGYKQENIDIEYCEKVAAMGEVLEWIESNGYTIAAPPRYSYVYGI